MSVKNKIYPAFRILFFTLIVAVFFACDMSLVNDSRIIPGAEKEKEELDDNDSNVISISERDELERTGHFLKLTHLPAETQTTNVFYVQVANSVSTIARFNAKNIWRFLDDDSVTLYIPLVYNDNTEFTETGSFYVAFQILVDAVTMYSVRITDMFLVPFVDGRGTVDIRTLPDKPVNDDRNVLSDIERDELERTGRFLKLTHMPANTQTTNVFSVQIANSNSAIAKYHTSGTVWLFLENNSCTIYIPLVYNDNTEFTETGSFFVAFQILVDAVTIYSVRNTDRMLVPFVNGRGTVDARTLPEAAVPYQSYLTISNLPANLSPLNISNVVLRNLAAQVAYCADYSLIEVSLDGGKSTARIPLSRNGSQNVFTETGGYFVSFDINVDASTRFLVTAGDQFLVSFVNGNGSFNIDDVPEKPVPYLTISGLPVNTANSHISNVSVYNTSASVAGCDNADNIVISKNGNYTTAQIPLSSNGGYFRDSGIFIITFTVNVDAVTRISCVRGDDLMLQFVNGSASFDLNSSFGHFDASLVNPSDTAAPRIRSNSAFDINGIIHRVTSDTSLNSILPAYSCVLYLYAYRLDNNVFYEYSSQSPSYNNVKKGYYVGSKRALWKMVYVHDTGQFVFKTYVDNSFPHLGSFTISNAAYDSFVGSRSPLHSLSGAGNPASTAYTLQSGLYVVRLSGAGGGGGYGAVRDSSVSGSSLGGSGGIVAEIVSIQTPVTFTAFTGSGGTAASAPALSGTFSILTTPNYIGFENGTLNQIIIYSDIVLNLFTSFSATSGGSGGGGGSGTFLYSADGYFLVAGGGGGGSGASWLTPGGGGGTGGAIGPGSGGGASGYFQQSFQTNVNMTAAGSAGGTGGGLYGGSGGQSTNLSSNREGGSVVSVLYSNTTVSGGGGAPSYPSSDFTASSGIPYLRWHIRTGPYDFDYFQGDETAVPALSFDSMSYTISANSGSGGAVAAVSHLSGPMEWLNTISVHGTGASAGTLSPNSLTGSISLFRSVYYWDPDAIYRDSFYNLSSFSFSLGDLRNGVNGTSGGNNRNSSRGGGGAGGGVSNSRPTNGAAGSLNIYKIF